MSTAIFLSNQEVKAVVGKKTGRQMTISRVCRAQAPEGSIINGQIINEEEFMAFVKDFWENNKLPKSDVVLTLGGTASANRLMQVPKMGHKQLMEYLPREYATTDQRKDPVFSYVLKGQEGKMLDLYTTMVERSFLEPHLRRFKEAGIKVSSVVTADIGRVVALDALSYLEGKTCVIQVLDGMSLNNILYVNGRYFQHNTRRIFGDRGTPAFGVECARSVSSLQQFLTTQQIDSAITNVYLCGEYGAEGLEVCRESMLQMDENLEVTRLSHEADGAIQFHITDEDFDYYTAPIGALMVPVGPANLLKQYHRDPEKLAQRMALAKYAAPLIGTGVVFGAAAAVSAVIWFQRTDQVNAQLDYLGNPLVIENAASFDRLKAENENLTERANIVGQTMLNLDSYPVYTSQTKQVILECAAGLGSNEVVSFDQVSGIVSVNTSSPSAEGAHQIVNRLEDRSDLFQDVYYDGFTLDERTGLWQSQLQCYLVGPAAEGSAADGSAADGSATDAGAAGTAETAGEVTS